MVGWQPRVERDRALGHVGRDARPLQRERRGQLEIPLGWRVLPLELRDPHCPVNRGPADCAVALDDELSRATLQGALEVDAEQVKCVSADRVEDAGMPLAGSDLA